MARSKKLKIPGMPVKEPVRTMSIPMAEKGEEEPPIDDNPEIKTYKKVDGALVIEKTHGKPVIRTESYKIEETQKQIDKIDDVISLWQGKRKKYQDLLDIYNGI